MPTLAWTLLLLGAVIWHVALVAGEMPGGNGPCGPCFMTPIFTVNRIDGITYGNAFNSRTQKNEDLLLDIYLPNDQGVQDQLRPLVVLIHGGACFFGSRQSDDYVSFSTDLAARGFVAASIDYRLTGDCSDHAAATDLATAIQYIIAERAQEWRVDTSRVALFGSSAGAIASLQLAYKALDCNGCQEGLGIDAVVSISGVLLKSGLENEPDALDPDEPPLYLLHGLDDIIVPAEASMQLKDRADQVGLANVLRLCAADHVPWDLIHSTYFNDIVAFIRTNLGLSDTTCPHFELPQLTCPDDLLPGFHTLELDLTGLGRTRQYDLYIPSWYNASTNALPLLLGFHGGGGDSSGFIKQSELARYADSEGFLVVFGKGNWISDDGRRTWNAGACCAAARDQDVDDVEYVSRILDDLARRGVVYNGLRVMSTGHSNGAMLSFRLGCELSTKISAIAPNAGAFGWRNFTSCMKECEEPQAYDGMLCFDADLCPYESATQLDAFYTCDWNTSERPIPSVLSFYGMQDTSIRYYGGLGNTLDPKAWTQWPVSYTTRHLYEQLGSQKLDFATAHPMAPGVPGSVSFVSEELASDTAVCVACDDCQHNIKVETCVMSEAGHTWAGGQYGPAFCPTDDEGNDASCKLWGQRVGLISQTLNATAKMISFFLDSPSINTFGQRAYSAYRQTLTTPTPTPSSSSQTSASMSSSASGDMTPTHSATVTQLSTSTGRSTNTGAATSPSTSAGTTAAGDAPISTSTTTTGVSGMTSTEATSVSVLVVSAIIRIEASGFDSVDAAALQAWLSQTVVERLKVPQTLITVEVSQLKPGRAVLRVDVEVDETEADATVAALTALVQDGQLESSIASEFPSLSSPEAVFDQEPTRSDDEDGGGSSRSPGEVAGIAIGVILAMLLLAAAVAVGTKHWRAQSSKGSYVATGLTLSSLSDSMHDESPFGQIDENPA